MIAEDSVVFFSFLERMNIAKSYNSFCSTAVIVRYISKRASAMVNLQYFIHLSIVTWHSIKINDYQSEQAFVLRLEVIGNWTSQNCFAILFANLQMSHKILFLLTVIYFYIGRKVVDFYNDRLNKKRLDS